MSKNISTICRCEHVLEPYRKLTMQKLFSKTEVAELLKVSPRYIELLVAKGVFPKPAYVGDHPIWRENELGAFIDKSLAPEQTVSAKK